MLQATALASVAWLAFGASPFASQAHRPDTINIDFDVPGVGQHLLKKGASSNQVSFVSVNDDAASDVTLHVPVPSVSSRQASDALVEARNQLSELRALARRQSAIVEMAHASMSGAASSATFLGVAHEAGPSSDALLDAVLDVVEAGGAAKDDVSSLMPANPNADQVAAEAAAIRTERNSPSLFACEADFSAPCPDGWQLSAGVCHAHDSYSGPCESSRRFSVEDNSEKQVFAEDCNAPWPCKGHGNACPSGHNFDACPHGWSTGRFGFCEAPAENACGQAFRFVDMSVDDKLNLAGACGFRWPCK
jgi:CPW-WPC domain-containing protein